MFKLINHSHNLKTNYYFQIARRVIHSYLCPTARLLASGTDAADCCLLGGHDDEDVRVPIRVEQELSFSIPPVASLDPVEGPDESPVVLKAMSGGEVVREQVLRPPPVGVLLEEFGVLCTDGAWNALQHLSSGDQLLPVVEEPDRLEVACFPTPAVRNLEPVTNVLVRHANLHR